MSIKRSHWHSESFWQCTEVWSSQHSAPLSGKPSSRAQAACAAARHTKPHCSGRVKFSRKWSFQKYPPTAGFSTILCIYSFLSIKMLNGADIGRKAIFFSKGKLFSSKRHLPHFLKLIHKNGNISKQGTRKYLIIWTLTKRYRLLRNRSDHLNYTEARQLLHWINEPWGEILNTGF